MAILTVSHLAIGVTDMDRALSFYRDFLGLTVIEDWLQEYTDRGRENSPGLADEKAPGRARKVRRRAVWLRWSHDPHGTAVVLDQLLEPLAEDRRACLYDLGTHHVSFWVDDIDAIVRRAEEQGIDIPLQPITSPGVEYGLPDTGIRSAYVRDPDGNLVQLDQRVPAPEITSEYFQVIKKYPG